ncbi:uncharacterized protein A1O9_11171 [Exophiala aquamarina CBS 119918]|uniref:Xylanolytic transcriptional activator regulatory domain-containing protein n=1 Tax=Exophiala aquamarina CBS 119918 TaxID=1182545 RepID=A0A072NXZ9_9EURO|nr:uncharacterized protein A1O9_11171 [Exophiala aquamarina CBS 119918]KEF52754.1 hypothetical protein A1O9_11171 [Exophiala aquamarina CBS 119918]
MPKRRSVDDEAADIDGNTATGGSYAYSHPGSYNVAGSNHGASTAQPNPPRRVASSSSLLPPNFLPPRPAWSSRTALSSTHSSPNIDESPEMFYAQIAERSVLANDDPIHPTGQSVFLGEAFSLTYVVHEVLAPHLSDSLHYKKRLHFPITDAATRRPRSFYVRDDTVANQVELLKRQGLFYRPPSEALQKLLDAYFEYFHPAYPLIERARFADALQAEQQSHLALNALLMIAVTLCDAETLEAVGCGDRHTARSTFFKQARILYDLDAERDKMNIIVGVFLMSFWWGGPNDQKDSWHWLGISLGLAQSLGLHRTWVL